MSKPKSCIVYIVRHGETEWNIKRLLQGHSDSPLTKLGKQQAKELRKKLQNINFDAVFSSDAPRAQRTAQIIMLERKLAIVTTELLREKNYGEHEGKSIEIYHQELKKHLEEYENLSDAQKWTYKFPSIETDEEAVGRIITYIREISVAYSGQTVLLVSHGTVMRLLLIHLGFANYKQLARTPISITNGSYIKLECDGVEFKILETSGINKQS